MGAGLGSSAGNSRARHGRIHAVAAPWRACHADATMFSRVCLICQFRSRAARSPLATIRAGSPGRGGLISGVNAMPVTLATASMISRTEMPSPAAEVVHRFQRSSLVERLGGGHMGSSQV